MVLDAAWMRDLLMCSVLDAAWLHDLLVCSDLDVWSRMQLGYAIYWCAASWMLGLGCSLDARSTGVQHFGCMVLDAAWLHDLLVCNVLDAAWMHDLLVCCVSALSGLVCIDLVAALMHDLLGCSVRALSGLGCSLDAQFTGVQRQGMFWSWLQFGCMVSDAWSWMQRHARQCQEEDKLMSTREYNLRDAVDARYGCQTS